MIEPLPIIDRFSWPSGPWDHEPDEANEVDSSTRLDLAYYRNSLGAWCGYVGLPDSHPFFGKRTDYEVPNARAAWRAQSEETLIDQIGVINTLFGAFGDDNPNVPLSLLIRCHGGLTYAGPGEYLTGQSKWWLGFDCSHSGDEIPYKKARLGQSDEDIYRTLDYVRSCARDAAKDIKFWADWLAKQQLPKGLSIDNLF